MDDAKKMKWGGRWDQMKGALKQRWGKAVDDAEMQAEGQVDKLFGKLREETGATDEDIEEQLDRHDKEKAKSA